MRTIIINPGTGPVANATEEHALKNIKQFIEDTKVEGIKCVRVPEEDADGRFAFLLWRGTRCHLVDMPGAPLEKVRYTDQRNQNIWDFPRLYVDGSSWVWIFAVNMCSAEAFRDPIPE